MKISSTDPIEKSNLNFFYTHSSIVRNRERIRSLGNIILSSCSVFLSISFVIFFFVVKELQLEKLTTLLFSISDLFIILAVFFCILSVYINPPKPVKTKLDLISEESLYLIKEQKNVRIAIVFLFVGIILFLIGLMLFALKLY